MLRPDFLAVLELAVLLSVTESSLEEPDPDEDDDLEDPDWDLGPLV